MSKNIDEITENILPDHFLSIGDNSVFITRKPERNLLKQAIQDKKLCLPLSEDELGFIIFKNIYNSGSEYTARENWTAKHWQDKSKAEASSIAKAVYQAQFKRGEK